MTKHKKLNVNSNKDKGFSSVDKAELVMLLVVLLLLGTVVMACVTAALKVFSEGLR